MKVDQNPFPTHTHVLELSNPKVLIRPSQAESTKGKNVVIGEARSRPSKPSKEIPEKKKDAKSTKTGLTGLETGLTGPSGSSIKIRSNKSKTRPSFKELLAKYEKEGAV